MDYVPPHGAGGGAEILYLDGKVTVRKLHPHPGGGSKGVIREGGDQPEVYYRELIPG